MVLDGKEQVFRHNEVVTVPHGTKHAFFTSHGAVIEEISSTHSAGDSRYSDDAINQNRARKTHLTDWMD